MQLSAPGAAAPAGAAPPRRVRRLQGEPRSPSTSWSGPTS
jgi:hypothetical protein